MVKKPNPANHMRPTTAGAFILPSFSFLLSCCRDLLPCYGPNQKTKPLTA